MKKSTLVVIGIVALAMCDPAFAASTTSSSGMTGILKNLMSLFKVGGQTIIIGSFAIGLACAAGAFWIVKGLGKPNSQNAGSWGGVGLLTLAAVGLIYLGAWTAVFGQTILDDEATTSSSIDKEDFGL